MAEKQKKKTVVVTTSRTTPSSSKLSKAQENTLIFGKQNYILMGVAFIVVALGMILMMGGGMPSPDVWDENIIYSFRRITLAPIVILAGLGIGLYSIFK